MPVPTIEPMYSTRTVAQRLGVGPDWVRRIFRHRPGVIRLSGHNIRIPESVILEVMREYGYAPTAAPAAE
jgi:hypothetical protein